MKRNISSFSLDISNNGNHIKEPKRQKAKLGKPPRLIGKARLAAEKEGGGSSASKLVSEFKRRIGNPVKCIVKDWYIYEEGRWRLVKNGRSPYVPLAMDVQSLENRNGLTADRIVKYFENEQQMKDKEEFVGAINHNAMISSPNSYLLNFPNGTLQINSHTGEIIKWMKHSPEHMFTATLGADYEDGADSWLFKETIRQILPRKADRLLLLDFFTSALLPHSHYQCALFCIGNGANGKSILTESLANAIGKDVRSAIRLHEICGGDRGKHIWQLARKLVNVSTETENRVIEDNSNFKSIVSGELFAVSKLYEHAYEMQTNVKLVSCSNHLPMFKYGTDAEDRRIRIIHFSEKFDGENSDLTLADRLLAEKKGILNYLVRRLPKVCKLGEMSRGSFVSQKVMKEFKSNNNIVSLFFEQCCEFIPTNMLGRQQLYEVFRQFSHEREDRCRLNSDQFFRQVRKTYPMVSTRVRQWLGKKVSMYSCRGVGLSDYGYALLTRKKS